MRVESRLMALDEDGRRRVARALLAWSGKTQPQLAKESGIPAARIKAWSDKRNTPPTTDELFVLAGAVGAPEHFVVDGWASPLHERVDELEALTAEISGTLRRVVADSVQHRLAIQELSGRRLPAEPEEDTPR